MVIGKIVCLIVIEKGLKQGRIQGAAKGAAAPTQILRDNCPPPPEFQILKQKWGKKWEKVKKIKKGEKRGKNKFFVKTHINFFFNGRTTKVWVPALPRP